ncbi:MAG: type II toxin-antitoxin system VapC family toxin [Proteobacteria bacterium]|nr:type II toxin-antitoxin system VapC family toxin [Pseudomonadota bacterium]
MSFVLDACALSELSRPRPDPGFVAWFDRQVPESLFISALTVGEIEKGVAALASGRKRTALAGWLATLRSEYGARIISIDDAAATIWGRLSAEADKRGVKLGVVDGLIAATAQQRGFTVVTRNVADFAPTGVAVLNPWER